jgi:tRNA nucleotidyltransferase (CCA-adding enzyme)
MKKIKFDFPNKIEKIFEYLQKHNANPIVVGGYVRDKLLGANDTKDIDVEVYNIKTYKELTELLKPFGKVNFVGRSFGVCKLSVEGFEIDFSLPRKETKTAKGHKGFLVETDHKISLKEAFRRRDFTINALGYDPIQNQIIDFFGGLNDLKKKILRAVDQKRFKEDPLRVLRAAVFASRLLFTPDKNLEHLCSDMIKQNMLNELPKERIFMEIEKLFLKSKKPSISIELLTRWGERNYFSFFENLTTNKQTLTLKALDTLALCHLKTFPIFWSILLFFDSNPLTTLKKFSDDKKLQKRIFSILTYYQELLDTINGCNIYKLKKLASKTPLHDLFVLAFVLSEPKRGDILKMFKKAKQIGILHKKVPPIISGDDLIKLGIAPSAHMGEILDKIYDLQLRGVIKKKEELTAEFIKKYALF